MPKTHLYTWRADRETIGSLSVKPPLENVQPAIGEDEPRDDYHKPWGYYPFIYESEDSLAIGGLAGFLYMPGSPGLGSGPWEVPNLELGGGGEGATPAGASAPATDLVGLLCTATNMASNEEVADLCMNLATVSGCVALTIISRLTRPPGSTFGIPFPNGFKMQSEVIGPLGGFGAHTDIFMYRIVIFNASGGNILECGGIYFDPSQGSDQNIFGTVVRANFGKARDDVLECLKAQFGNTFAGLGCVA